MGYAPHPRFGETPRITGLDPDPDAGEVHLHWNTRRVSLATRRILEEELDLDWGDHDPDLGRAVPYTAVLADLEAQTPACVPVTHYLDIEKRCRVCGSLFLFFAEEQKYWYEVLRLPLEADAVACCACRRDLRALEATNQRYQALVGLAEPDPVQQLELCESSLTLMEAGMFGRRAGERVRQFCNRNPDHPRIPELRSRLAAIELGRK